MATVTPYNGASAPSRQNDALMTDKVSPTHGAGHLRGTSPFMIVGIVFVAIVALIALIVGSVAVSRIGSQSQVVDNTAMPPGKSANRVEVTATFNRVKDSAMLAIPNILNAVRNSMSTYLDAAPTIHAVVDISSGAMNMTRIDMSFNTAIAGTSIVDAPFVTRLVDRLASPAAVQNTFGAFMFTWGPSMGGANITDVSLQLGPSIALTMIAPTPTSSPVPIRVVTTLAGGGAPGVRTAGSTDATGVAATFWNPRGMAADNDGNLYIVNQVLHVIRRMVIATRVVTTVAGGPFFSFGFVDAVGTNARFLSPTGLTFDGAGNLFVADTGNCVIRRISIANASVTTLAGGNRTGGNVCGYRDGVGVVALFSDPIGIAFDGSGSLFVSEHGSNHMIRKIIIATATVTAVAGSLAPGRPDGVGEFAAFSSPSHMFVSGGVLYVADQGNHCIRRIDLTTNAVTTLAGGASGFQGGSSNGVGTAATFSSPSDVTGDGGDRLFVADQSNHRIRQIRISTGEVSPTAGSSAGLADGSGTIARFTNPHNVLFRGNLLYVADTNNHVIRSITLA